MCVGVARVTRVRVDTGQKFPFNMSIKYAKVVCSLFKLRTKEKTAFVFFCKRHLEHPVKLNNLSRLYK